MHSQCLLLAGQAPVNSQLSLIPLVAAYENHSRKRPAPVTDTLLTFQGCPFTRDSAVYVIKEMVNATAVKLSSDECTWE